MVSVHFSYFVLVRPTNLHGGLYVLLSLISFFFIFLNDFMETNYLRIRWTDFHNLSPNESVLGADDRSGPFF